MTVNIGKMDSVIRCGLPSRAEQAAIDSHNRMKQFLDVAAEKGLRIDPPHPFDLVLQELNTAKAAQKTTSAPLVELWWQKADREAKEKRDEVVALRCSVRSLLGM